MAKFFVTPELAEMIRFIRIQSKIASKELALHIQKSPSYISKLENGGIKTIQETELTSILNFIIQGQDSFDEKINSVIKTLSIKYSQKEIDEQLWLLNYDTVYRQIPIPSELVDDLNKRINTIGVDLSYLIDRINANEGLSPLVTNIATYPFNEWCYYLDDGKHSRFIKLKVKKEEIEAILSRRSTATKYIYLLGVVYYLFKIEEHGNTVVIPEDVSQRLMCSAYDYLSRFKFYSLSEKNRLMRQTVSKEEQRNLLSSFEQANIEVVNKILALFQIMSELNMVKANEQFEAFLKNLEWDQGFIMKLLSSTFFQLKDVSYNIKRNLLNEIINTLEKYKTIPDNEKGIEFYE